jgi:hypothetical protein
LEKFIRPHAIEIQRVPGLDRQLMKETKLRPTVTFPKWMYGVQLGQEMAGSFDKVLEVSSR